MARGWVQTIFSPPSAPHGAFQAPGTKGTYLHVPYFTLSGPKFGSYFFSGPIHSDSELLKVQLHKICSSVKFLSPSPIQNFGNRQSDKPPSKVSWLRGTWVARSVKCPTWAQVMISWFVSLSPTSGSVLTARSLEPA